MSVRLRVHGGTLKDVRLCDTCRYSHITKYSNGGEKISCVHSGGVVQITGKVVECNQYGNQNDKTEYELSKIGWVLEVKGKTILGFRQPKKEDVNF